ncbi:MAG: hypothetical protein O7F12_04560 [Nitrospirae bacterium]|nr:hypothetical protein [Nitrospirota bacterium]
MDSRFFQFSSSGIAGLVFYLIGDDLAASKAYREHFRHVVQNHKPTAKVMAIDILSGELDELQKDAEVAQKLDSNDPNALLTLGAVALEKGNPKQASLFFNQVLQTYPDHARGLLYSAIAQARIGHFKNALDQINRGLRNNKIAWDYYSFLLLLETAGSFHDKPDSEKPWSFLAQLYRYLRIFDPSNGARAIEYAQEAVEANNFPAHAYLIMSVVYTKQGKLIQALKAALQSTEVDKTFPDGYWQAGYIYGRLGDIANSYVAYKTAFELAPSEPLFMNNLGFVMIEKLGDAQQTIQLFERAVQANPRNWHAYQWLGWAYAFLADHENAISRYSIAREIVLEDRAKGQGEEISLEGLVDIHEELASSQRALGHIDDAIATLRQAIELAPYDGGVRSRLVYMLSGINRFKEAIQEIDIALQHGGLTINTHSGLCSVLYTALKSQRAADCFRQVLKRDPYDMRARRLLPEVLESVKLEKANMQNLGQSRL